MRKIVALATLAVSMVVLPADYLPTAAAAQKNGKAGAGIADPSDWNVVITRPGGARQTAVIRVRNGVLYPAINNVASGTVFVDGDGLLHIDFRGHPKVAIGTALLERPTAGRWQGVLTEPSGQSTIEMKRK